VENAEAREALAELLIFFPSLVVEPRARGLALRRVPLLAQGSELGLHLLPLRRERAQHDRLDDQHDLVAVGVVRAQLAALVGVEAPLEESAEDRRLDRAPVERG